MLHEDSIIPKTCVRELKYEFSAVETHELSMQLANKIKEIDSVKNEAKAKAAEYNAKRESLDEQIKKLSNNVSSGYEYRQVDCTIEYNKPKQGIKTLIRNDNGIKIEEKMEDWEWNLFTSVTTDDGLLPAKEEKPKKKPNPRPAKEEEGELFNSDDLPFEVL